MQLSIVTAITSLLAFTSAATVQERQHPACAPYFYEGSVFPFDYAWGKYKLCCNYNGVNSADGCCDRNGAGTGSGFPACVAKP
ncbi:hypothetical protein HYQ45_001413 [Verticillium longisporum]|uniref:Uncharacterized protein n=1 Tax=Verticillium longisporum TaxID=100787 RepID=A0A8I3AW50_VERLO|nr:hypothetical protein HYQ44_016618 [Verticillium longisporum]KAG7142136.1 hypothetical protein HYQ45_001413 [Verticillium longisporum]KAG7150934.1 hypothetical protein HYQ46_000078 [Verticillium longisporum]